MPPQSHSQSNNEEPSTSEFSQDLSENTRKAYATDWALYTRWCRMQGTPPLAATPDHIARYLTEISAASGLSSASVRRRLAGLVWNYHQRGFRLDRDSPLIAAALSEITTNKPCAAVTKDAITPQEIRAMVATLPFDLRGLRDRAILLMGYNGGLGRSDLIGLDLHQNDTEGGTGWIELHSEGILLTIKSKTGWRKVQIACGNTDLTCPVYTLSQWLHFAKIRSGPVFVRTSRDGKRALSTRLNDRHIPRLVKSTILKAGIRADLPEKERLALFSGHSLKKGLSVSVDQSSGNQIEVNLTKAAGF